MPAPILHVGVEGLPQLNERRTLDPQIDDSAQLVGGEAFAPNQLQNLRLVAHGDKRNQEIYS